MNYTKGQTVEVEVDNVLLGFSDQRTYDIVDNDKNHYTTFKNDGIVKKGDRVELKVIATNYSDPLVKVCKITQ